MVISIFRSDTVGEKRLLGEGVCFPLITIDSKTLKISNSQLNESSPNIMRPPLPYEVYLRK